MHNSLVESVLSISTLTKRWCELHPKAPEVPEVRKAVSDLRRAVLKSFIHDADAEPADAELFVQAYIQSGASWADLTAAVSRHAITGSTRRAGQ